MQKERTQKYNAYRTLCLQNAEDFIRTAEELLGKNVNHIAFHLAALAMEEMGKLSLVWFQLMGEDRGSETETNLSTDDHIKKLFLAIWLPSFGSQKITKEQIEERQSMATNIHNRRLFSLYSDTADTVPSSQKINNQECEQFVKFARATVEISKAKGGAAEDLPPEDIAELDWFLVANEDPEKRKLIFGHKSQEKLIELGNVKEWIKWVKQSFEKNDEELKELIQQELQRKKPSEEQKFDPKWKIKFKIITPSHTVKNKNLNEFNKGSRWIQLHKGADNHTLIVDLTLSKVIPARLVWDRGWMISRIFVASLNIGTNGLFWWNTPVDIARYYEKIWDEENKVDFVTEISPRLQLNWKEQKLKLDENALNHTSLAFAYLIRIMDAGEFEPINNYIIGLSFLAKNDVHLRLELNAFDMFFKAFRVALLLHKDFDPSKEDVKEAGYRQISEALAHRTEFDKLMDWGTELLTQREQFSKPITLTEVIAMKNYCGLYFVKLAARHLYKAKDVRLVMENSDGSSK